MAKEQPQVSSYFEAQVIEKINQVSFLFVAAVVFFCLKGNWYCRLFHSFLYFFFNTIILTNKNLLKQKETIDNEQQEAEHARYRTLKKKIRDDLQADAERAQIEANRKEQQKGEEERKKKEERETKAITSAPDGLRGQIIQNAQKRQCYLDLYLGLFFFFFFFFFFSSHHLPLWYQREKSGC